MTEVLELSVIDMALEEANVTNQVIQSLKDRFSNLRINGIGDKIGFNEVEDARKECKAVRVLATKICKQGREDAIKTQRDWIAKEKEVVGIYISGHPLDDYRFAMQFFCNSKLETLKNLNPIIGKSVTIAGIVSNVQYRTG